MSGEVFETVLKVRFADVDHAGVVYYPQYLHYFHVAYEEWWEHAFGMPYARALVEHGAAFPAVHVEADYRAPARYGDELRLEVQVARVGTKSVTLGYRAARVSDGTVCVEGLVTTVCVELPAFSSLPIPPVLRAFFERFRTESTPE